MEKRKVAVILLIISILFLIGSVLVGLSVSDFEFVPAEGINYVIDTTIGPPAGGKVSFSVVGGAAHAPITRNNNVDTMPIRTIVVLLFFKKVKGCIIKQPQVIRSAQ